MANGKKSFLMYCDLIHTAEKLSDENAGKLLKHLLRYVNDQNPTPENDYIDLVFEPIKQQLKRDLGEWEDKKSERSISGRMGNLKRWNKDLYLKVEREEMKLEEAESIAINRKTSLSDKNIANVAVNDTVNVNGNVTVNDILLEKETKGITPEKSISEEDIKILETPKERKKVPPKKESHFVIPTIEEIQNYTHTREVKINAIRFHNHYTSNGWMVGKSKMKDWKAAVRTWEGNEQKSFTKNTPLSNGNLIQTND